MYGERLGEPALGGLPEEIAQEAGRRLAVPGRAAQRRPGRRRRLLGAHPRRRRARGLRGQRALFGRHRRDRRRPVRAPRPVRSTRPWSWPGRAPTASPSRAAAPCSPRASSRTSPTRVSLTDASSGPVRRRRAQRAQPVRQEQGRRPGRPRRARGADRAHRRGRRGAQRGARERSPSRPGCSRRWARSGTPPARPSARPRSAASRRGAAARVAASSRPTRRRSCARRAAAWRGCRPAREGPGSVVRLEEPRDVRPAPARRPSSASTSAPPAPRPRCSTSPPAPCSAACTGAPRATRWRRRRRWSPRSARCCPTRWSPWASPARGATPRPPCSAPRTRTSARGSPCRTRSSRTPTAAARLDPDGGRSLSIVEIGGQDAKFINVEGGRVVDADMNRVCSAGTGSFLEEQAHRPRRRRHRRVRAARGAQRRAARPRPDLHRVRRRRRRRGAERRLLARGHLRRPAVLRGAQLPQPRDGPAAAARAVSSSRASRPPTRRWRARWPPCWSARSTCRPTPAPWAPSGIALLAGRGARRQTRPPAPEAIDLARVLEARVAGRREFQCKDRDCLNLCRLELAEIDVARRARARSSAAASAPSTTTSRPPARSCPRTRPTRTASATSCCGRCSRRSDRRRDAVRVAALQPIGPARTPLPHRHAAVLPHVPAPARATTSRCCVRAPTRWPRATGAAPRPGACAPVKLLHGLAGADVDVLVAPLFVHLPLPNAGDVTYTCPMAQGAPDMAARALAAEGSPTRVLRPVLFEQGRRRLRRAAGAAGAAARGRGARGGRRRRGRRPLARALRAPPTPPRWPASAASRTACASIGERALAWAREHDYPVVLIVGETHVIHDAVLDAGIHELVAANGALAAAGRLLSGARRICPGSQRVHWASAGQTLRAAAAGAMAGDVFPLLLGAYGCGPNSMIEHLFADLVEDWPHAVLESDGHGGKAGYVTRVQAFLHSVRAWRADGGGQRCPPARLARFDRPLPHSLDAGYDRFFFGHVGGGLGRHLAAAMRGAGFDATLRRRARRRRAARRRRGLLRQGVPALPAHLGQLRPLPRRGGAAARRPARPVPQRRQRLPGLPRQPLPVHRADRPGAARAGRPAWRSPTSASSPPTCA